MIYAGGKLIGPPASFKVLKESSRSHLTQLWNDNSESNSTTSESEDRVSRIFLIAVLLIALITGIYWYIADPSKMTTIVVSVLIVACPCALALSKPFTYGSIMRLMGRKGIYLKNTSVIDEMKKVDSVVFDKTGTLTTGSDSAIQFNGEELSKEEEYLILVTANASTHPLSRSIVANLKSINTKPIDYSNIQIEERSGEGIEAVIDGVSIKIGTPKFVGFNGEVDRNEISSFISIGGNFKGRYIFSSELRSGIGELLKKLASKLHVHILSGDKDKDKEMFENLLPAESQLRFNQTPQNKRNFIANDLADRNVMMVGDGLNDAGALELAGVGVAVSEDIFRFTPNSDAIIEAKELNKLDKFLSYSKYSTKVLRVCYGFSIAYNLVGLSFAVTGSLTPLIAAILMPLSSISIVLIASIGSSLKG